MFPIDLDLIQLIINLEFWMQGAIIIISIDTTSMKGHFLTRKSMIARGDKKVR